MSAELIERLRSTKGPAHVVRVCFDAADALASKDEEIVRHVDKIEGLESDLFYAVQVAYQRGAVEWVRLNYPAWYERFKVGGGQPKEALQGDSDVSRGGGG